VVRYPVEADPLPDHFKPPGSRFIAEPFVDFGKKGVRIQ
jgi:hypothetical protein